MKHNEYTLQKRKMMTSAALHENSIQRGETLLQDIDGEMKTHMKEMQTHRIIIDDVDLELQYLTEEMVNFKKRQAEELENEKRRQLARMQDNISEFEDDPYGSTIYDYSLRG